MSRLARSARLRRVARLLVALGDPPEVAISRARRLASRVADGARGERLVILDHRTRAPGGGDRIHESWVLRRAMGWSERDAARALDCSRTVHRRHVASWPAADTAEEVQRIDDIRVRMELVPVVSPRGVGTLPDRARRLGVTAIITTLAMVGLSVLAAWLD